MTDGQTVEVSSTAIRDMVTKGKVADAAILLGRPYRLIGNIVPGRGKGKQLGFPTLNLEKPQQIVPAEGVYAGTAEVAESIEKVCIAKERIPAALSIGRATTYGAGQSLLIEAHLLSRQRRAIYRPIYGDGLYRTNPQPAEIRDRKGAC